MPVHTAPVQLMYTDQGQIVMQRCQLYKRHFSPVLENHHICPQSWFKAAGKPVQTPMILLCGTCHDTVHATIDALITGKGIDAVGRNCVTLARRALTLAHENGLIPARTL